MTVNHDLLEDLPPGPLQEFRNKASFDWKNLKLLVEDEDVLQFKVCINGHYCFYDSKYNVQ